jgi:hypothetical protein
MPNREHAREESVVEEPGIFEAIFFHFLGLLWRRRPRGVYDMMLGVVEHSGI